MATEELYTDGCVAVKEEPEILMNPELVEVKPDVSLLIKREDDFVYSEEASPGAVSTKKQHERKFFCAACKTSYSSKRNLNIHLGSKIHKSEKRFQCGHCQKRFSLQLYLKRHKVTHISSNSFIKCPKCWKRFFRLSDFLMHKKRHQDECYQCSVGTRNCDSKNSFTTHNCKVRYECHCRKTYATLRGLKLHQGTHMVDKTYKCDKCFKVFSVKKYLQSHMAFHQSVMEAVVCDICYRRFPRMSNLRNHMKTHQSVQCDNCKLSFNRIIDLKRHIKTHQIVHACNVCGRSFKSLSYLKQHVLKHENSACLVRCDQCAATFRFPSRLARHVALKHEKKAQHPCADCGKAFRSALQLSLHSKVHQPLSFDDAPGLVGYFNDRFSSN